MVFGRERGGELYVASRQQLGNDAKTDFHEATLPLQRTRGVLRMEVEKEREEGEEGGGRHNFLMGVDPPTESQNYTMNPRPKVSNFSS